MMSLIRTSLALAALVSATPALAQSQSTAMTGGAEEVSIPFAQFGGIDDWRADGTKALYVKGRGKDWYYATLMSTCQGLNFAQTIGFRNEASGSFDKFSTILVDGQPCQLTSLTKSEKPTTKK
jgi:hypothetical protein